MIDVLSMCVGREDGKGNSEHEESIKRRSEEGGLRKIGTRMEEKEKG